MRRMPSDPHPVVGFAAAVTVAGLLFFPSTPRAQTQTADYEISFESTWSQATHPNEFPNGAHFSPLVGGLHDGNVVFWEPGAIASAGIERMAEVGATSTLIGEIEAEIAAGFAHQSFVGSGIGSPGSTSLSLTVDRDFPLLTLVSMLAPSPDWFVGVHDLPLFDQGWWVPRIEVELFTYDAGSDLGSSYSSPNQDAIPKQPIALQGAPLEPGVPVGSFTIRRLPEPVLGEGLLLALPILVCLAGRRAQRRAAAAPAHPTPDSSIRLPQR